MKTKFSSLSSHDSLLDFLSSYYSKNKCKKYLPKNFLSKSIKEKDEIEIDLNLINSSMVNPNYTGTKIEIIHEDEKVIAVNKLHQMHGHPQEYLETNTVLNFLRSQYLISWDQFKDPEKGLLYRLDFETSGVLIFVKSPEEHKKMRENFNQMAKKKVYHCLVEGNLKNEGVISHNLIGSSERGSIVKVDEKGTECSLEILEREYDSYEDQTLVKISLLTGYRHQIRVQLAALGHPIIGDPLYGNRKAKRMFLHAGEYQIDQSIYSCNPDFK